MKSVIQRSFTLAASVFLVLLLSSTAFAFPSVYSNEIFQEGRTYWDGGSSNVYMAAGASYNSVDMVVPMIDDPNGDDPVAAVPEPATIALMIAGLLGLGLLHRRRLNKSV